MLYFLVPDHDRGSAGVRKLYLDVQSLIAHGIEAIIVHESRGFRCTWFSSTVPVIARDQVRAEGRDVIVIPEIYGSTISRLYPGTNKVIYNQNWANTFVGYSLGPDSPYLNPEILAVLCASERDREFLVYAFPALRRDRIFPVCYSVDPDLFFYSEEKRDQIAYMTHKNLGHLEQVLCLLQSRGALRGWNVVPIENMSYAETASVLRESRIFLSGSFPEGFSLVAAEAIACGCAVVGYFDPQYFGCWHMNIPVSMGNILEFTQAVERVMSIISDIGPLTLGFLSDNVRHYYSPEREAERTLNIWRDILPWAVEMPARPRYSIIVPCWNNVQLTVNCLRSIAQYSDCYEIIVIDNGSTDGARDVLARMASADTRICVIINDENLGWTRAINRGSREARGDFLVWLNNDTIVSEGWLHQLAGHLEPGTGAVGPVSPNGGWRQNAALSGPISETVRFLTGFCLMIPREVWLRVGGLDESFSQGADDLDYSLRLQRAGYRLAIARDVVIEHVGGASFQNLESCGGTFGSDAYARFMREGLVAFTNKWGPEWLNYLMGRDFLPPRN